jgi:2-polyprenyl-6-hydroxyphenyl methylase/3-demethylubiquinone-9 3-methyltransferase
MDTSIVMNSFGRFPLQNHAYRLWMGYVQHLVLRNEDLPYDKADWLEYITQIHFECYPEAWIFAGPASLYNAGQRISIMMANVNNRIYDDLAETWWDEKEFLHLLKVMVNPWRVPYFKKVLEERYGRDVSQVYLLDIGCGGGVLTEEFASLGCRVTGIDISPRSIAIAQVHAARAGLFIDYQVGAGTHLSFDRERFDAVSCCDVLEHIHDWKRVITEAGRVLKPGGLFFFDTINRTQKSKIQFIYGLQEFPLTRLMPADTHIWEMFIKPEELGSALRENGFILQDMKGGKIVKNPLATLWDVQQQKQGRITFAELGRRLELKLDGDLSLNYLGYARKSL